MFVCAVGGPEMASLLTVDVMNLLVRVISQGNLYCCWCYKSSALWPDQWTSFWAAQSACISSTDTPFKEPCLDKNISACRQMGL